VNVYLKRVLVVDANIFIEGFDLDGYREKFILMTTPGIVSEVERIGDQYRLEYALGAGLKVSHPSDEHVRSIEVICNKMGEGRRLSKIDVELLALAERENAIVISDDYSVQNIAAVIGLEVLTGLQRGIKEIYRWGKKCEGCRRKFSDVEKSYSDCPVCGSKLKDIRIN